MNTLEKKMVATLQDLIDNYGAVEVKAEFESEGTRLSELMRLKDVVSTCGSGLIVKIGGPEAVRDLLDSLIVGVTGIVAPMVESAYALKKFLMAVDKYVTDDARTDIAFAINIETRQAHENLDDMLSLPGVALLKRITVGRVDLSGSLGLSRNEINSDKVFSITKSICEKARGAGLSPTLGGGIAKEAVPFINKLVESKLLDRFETRKIVFSIPEGLQDVETAIIKANRFELLWLQNKRDYYSQLVHEDLDRIKMLESRVL